MNPKIELKELTPALWPDLEKLFGENGACGGCWCMSWRTEKGDKWENIRGAEAKKQFRSLVKSEKAHGILAYMDEEPVGWCAFDRRVEFAKLNRAPSFKCNDAEKVWSLPCFYIKPGFRGQGVATRLLQGALDAMKKRKVHIVEGYPVKASSVEGKKIPAAFAWTGTESLFQKAGFKVVGNEAGGKKRVRRLLVDL
jgi:GNAT superfamily N-acetyltransferase